MVSWGSLPGQNNMNKCIKVRILKPADPDMSWKDLGDLLHDLSYKAYRITNFVLLQEYLYAMKEEHNPEYLNDKGKLYLYPAITRTYPELSSHVVNGIAQNASKLFRTHAKGIFRGDETLPTMKRNAPISFHNKGYTFTREPVIYNGKPQELFVATVTLYRKRDAKEKGIPSRYGLVLADNWRDRSARVLLGRMADGTLRHGDGKISCKHGKWYLLIPYVVEDIEKPALKDDVVMGVKFGTDVAFSYAFNNTLTQRQVRGGEILAFRKRIRERRISIQNQYPVSGRQGRGRKKALRVLRALELKEQNFRAQVNYRYAKFIVHQALKEQAATIRLEDLTGIVKPDSDMVLKNWPFFDLRTKVTQRAERYGIKVETIPAQQIAGCCSQCGAVHQNEDGKAEILPTEEFFVCRECGYGNGKSLYHEGKRVPSAYNAARALAKYDGPVQSAKSGTRKDQVIAWRKKHPEGTREDCRNAIGCSKATVDKYWNYKVKKTVETQPNA